MKGVAAIGVSNLLLQRLRALERPAIEGDHLRRWQGMRGLKAVQVAEQETHRVAHAPVGITHAAQDFLREAHLVGIVGRCHPEPQGVRAQGLHNVLRLDAIAQRLGHLAALLID